MEKGKITLTQKDAENTPAGGVVVGKRDGQTMIYDDASLGGYFVGKLHKDGGIKMVNKSTGQPLEVQGAEVIITAPAVNDQTKREFEGKMMTNREILSKINSDGGGVSFADGGDIPAKIHTTDCEYKFGGKVVKDTDIAHSLGMNSTLKKGKQQFSSGDTTYDVDAIYNAIKKGKLRLKTKEVETFPMKYPVYDKNYAENHKIDFRKPNGITVRTESGEEILIDGNHRMNNAYSKGRKTMKTYYVEDPKQISKFSKKNKFMIGGYNARTISSFDNPKEAIEYVDKEIVGKAVGIYTGGKLKEGGHLSSGKSLKQIAEMHNVSLAHINEQLAKGLEVEKEHFADFKERTRVAKDHLVENPNYYTILEKAGLKDGGHLRHHRHSDNLVKDAKSGNTPARDLNNYNDIMDLEADGMVGMESGLAFDDGGITPIDANIEGDSVDIVESDFAKGGVVYDTTKPKIEKITIKDTKFNRTSVIGRNATTVSEFQQIVSDYIGNTPKEDVDWISFYVNDSTRGSYYIDLNKGKKNTVKNVNPETLNSLNFRRVIDAKTYLVKNYDWTDFFELGSQTPVSTSAQSQYPEYYKFIGKSDDSFTYDKIYQIRNPKDIEAMQNFIDNFGTYNGFSGSNYEKFKPSTKEAFLAQKSGLTKEDLVNTKIWIGDDLKLLEQVKDKLESLGFNKDKVESGDTNISIFIFYDDFYIMALREKSDLFNDSALKEIFPSDLGIDVNTTGVTPTTSNASTSAKPLSLSNTKVWLGEDYKQNLELSKKIQEKAFELGWGWFINGKDKKLKDDIQPQAFYFNDKNEMTYSSGLSGRDYFDKNEDKEFTPEQILSIPTPTSSQSAITSNYEDTVESVIINYGKFNGYIATNVEKLLDEIKRLWKEGGRSEMEITLQPQNVNGLLDNTFYLKLDNVSNGIFTIEPDNISLSELKDKLSHFYALDWSKFFNVFGNASTSAKPFDFSSTKIDVSNNPELSVKVQKKAFEEGWEWENGGGKTIDYNTFNYLYFTKTSISYGNSISSFNNSPKRKITEAEIFGSQAPATIKTNTISSTEKSEVYKVTISYELFGKKFDEICNNGQELFSVLNIIEEKAEGEDVELKMSVNSRFKDGQNNDKLVTLTIGENYFKPSEIYSWKELENIAENWFRYISFSEFFGKSQTPTLNSVTAISITYDSKVNINSGGISIANNPTELYEFLKGLLNGDYKNVKIQPTGNSINVNPALLYLDDIQWYSILTNNSLETALKEINKILNIIFPELNFDSFVNANSVVKTVENSVYNLDLAVQKLEKASSLVVTEYNKEIYDKTLKFLYDTKASYELALKFTPESAFMYERLDILKKLADIEKKIKNIEDMKKGGTFYMLAKILEKLERGENWKMLEQSQDVITNQIPQSEIDVIIRSQKFKNWFGDWEKALINDEYDNVSKALTNGIPSVYHHGARRIKYTYREVSNGVLYLAENISYAVWFSQNATAQSEEGNYLTECFVNIKNPIDLTAFHVNKVDLADIVRYVDAVYPLAKIYDFIPTQVALLIKTNQPTNVRMWAWQLIRSYAKFVNHIKENTPYDGFLYYENNPSDEVINPATGQLEENVTKAVAIFKSHQVKVVDAVLFDGGLDDWRFENGGKIKN